MRVLTAATPALLPQANPHDLLVFLVQLGLLLGLALVLGRLAARLGLPAVVGELLTGLLLGPTLLGHLAPRLWHWLFPAVAAQANMMNAIGQFGILLLVGVSGMHIDLGLIRRRGATAARVSLGGLLIPLALGIGLGTVLPATMLSATGHRSTFALFLGVAMCVSAIPVIAKTLLDMNLLHRDIGQLTMAAGAIDDGVGWCLLSVVSAMAVGGVHGWHIVVTVLEVLAFLLGAGLFARPLLRMLFGLAGRSAEAGPERRVDLLDRLGHRQPGLDARQVRPFGAFVAGTVLGTASVRTALDPARLASLRTFVMWIGAPLFLATAGLRMDLTALRHRSVLVSAILVLTLAVVGKFLGAYLGARLSRLPAREGFALGAAMNARGVVEVVVAMAGLRLGVISTATYTVIVLVAIVTSLMAPPLLRRAMSSMPVTAPERVRGLEHARWAGKSVSSSITD